MKVEKVQKISKHLKEGKYSSLSCKWQVKNRHNNKELTSFFPYMNELDESKQKGRGEMPLFVGPRVQKPASFSMCKIFFFIKQGYKTYSLHLGVFQMCRCILLNWKTRAEELSWRCCYNWLYQAGSDNWKTLSLILKCQYHGYSIRCVSLISNLELKLSCKRTTFLSTANTKTSKRVKLLVEKSFLHFLKLN